MTAPRNGCSRPPRLAAWLLALAAPEADRRCLLDDPAEELERVAHERRSARSASPRSLRAD